MNAVIYARFSSDNQSEESITAQVRACTEFAERNNYSIVDTYIDRAMSARSDARPAFQKMIADSASHAFDVVIVHKLDRFSRDRYDHAIYRKELKRNGVRLTSVLENLDDSPESVVLESVLEGFSEYYSRNLARETRKGLREVALQAKFTGGSPPFGYDVDADNRYVVNPAEAACVQRIYTGVLEGVGYDKLAAELSQKGITTKAGKPFTRGAFNAILKNEKYIGNYIYYPEGSSRQKISAPIVIEDALPAIVDKKIFWEVQRIMQSRRRQGRNRAIEPYLLSGIIFCGQCGAPMSGHRRVKNGKTYFTYECNRSSQHQCDLPTVSRAYVEGPVCDYLQKLLSDDTTKEIFAYLRENQTTLNALNEGHQMELQKELTSLDRKINNVIDLLADSPSDNLKRKLAELETRQRSCRMELDTLEASTLSNKKIEDYVVRTEDFANMDRHQKQIFISRMIKKVTVYKDGHMAVSSIYEDEIHRIVGGATQNRTGE